MTNLDPPPTDPLDVATVATPGRPRDAAIDDAVMESALTLLDENGPGPLSIDAIAAHAGVSKASIYRRWDSKGDVLIDAINSLAGDIEEPDTGAIRSDLIRIVGSLTHFMSDARAGSLLPWLVGEIAAGSEMGIRYLETVIMPRRAMMSRVIDGAVDRGELRIDLDVAVAVDMLIGPLVVGKLTRSAELSNPMRHAVLVDTLLAGWTPVPTSTPPDRVTN